MSNRSERTHEKIAQAIREGRIKTYRAVENALSYRINGDVLYIPVSWESFIAPMFEEEQALQDAEDISKDAIIDPWKDTELNIDVDRDEFLKEGEEDESRPMTNHSTEEEIQAWLDEEIEDEEPEELNVDEEWLEEDDESENEENE